MQAPREGSRKASVFAAFIAEGEKAAYKVAAELELKAGTVKSWIGSWSKGGPVVEKTARPAPTPKPEPKGNVRVVWSKRPVKLVGRGEQVSVIKWLDTGTEQALSNEQIEFAKQA